MKDENNVWFVVIGIIGLLLLFGGRISDFLGSLHPGQPSEPFGDDFLCGFKGDFINYPQCWDFGSMDCFGASGEPVIMFSDSGSVFRLNPSDFSGRGAKRMLSQWYSFDGLCVRLEAPMSMSISYGGYFTEKADNKATVTYSSGWKQKANYQFIAWITYQNPSTGSLETVSQYWTWNRALEPGVQDSYEITIPQGLRMGEYRIHVVSAIIGKSDAAYPHTGPLASYAQQIRPFTNAPEGFGRIERIQETGYWERPLLINTMPIYGGDCSNTTCDEGYTCQQVSKLCLRTDILENKLGCQTVGCPVTEGKTYLCSSSGICTETVTQYKACVRDEECPSETTCDTSSGTCIRTELYKELIQCTMPSDCYVPCSAITVGCEQNKCTYQGSCNATGEGFKDCNSQGCNSGVCNKETGVCYSEKIPINNPTVPSNYKPLTTTTVTTPIMPVKKSWWSNWYLIPITLIIAGGAYLTSKRR